MTAAWGLGLTALVALAGCVGAPAGEGSVSREVTVGGTRMLVTQQADTQIYGMLVDDNGQSSGAVVGAGRALLVSGAADQDMAIRAMGVFCSYDVDPAEWDTDYVHRFDGTNDFQFGRVCQ